MGNKSGNCYNTGANDEHFELVNKRQTEPNPVYMESEANLDVHMKAESEEEVVEVVEVVQKKVYAKREPEVNLYRQEPSDFTPEIAGNFIQGKLNGKGSMTYPNGSVYEGSIYIAKSMFELIIIKRYV